MGATLTDADEHALEDGEPVAEAPADAEKEVVPESEGWEEPNALGLIEGVMLTVWLSEKHMVRVKAALVGMGLKEMLGLGEEEMELVSLMVIPALCDAL